MWEGGGGEGGGVCGEYGWRKGVWYLALKYCP